MLTRLGAVVMSVAAAAAATAVLPAQTDRRPSQAAATESARLLPADDTVPGWRRSSEPLVFAPDTLWDYINGQAVHYLDYGFQQLAVAEYAAGDQSGVVAVEIYLMASPAHAFGIYASERVPGDTPADIGAGGYASVGLVNFWKGRCYVKVTGFGAAEGNRALLVRFAETTATAIVDEATEPALLTVLPAEHRVPGSERFIPNNVLGQSYLRNGTTARYQRGDETYQLVLIDLGSPSEAAASLARYEAFLRGEGYAVASADDDGAKRVRATRDRAVDLFVVGGIIGGVIDATDAATAASAATALRRAVSPSAGADEPRPDQPRRDVNR